MGIFVGKGMTATGQTHLNSSLFDLFVVIASEYTGPEKRSELTLKPSLRGTKQPREHGEEPWIASYLLVS